MPSYAKLLTALLLASSIAWAADPILTPGVEYHVIEMNGRKIAPADDFRVPTILIDVDEARISGTSGVNNYGGSYKLEKGKVQFGQLISTMMAAPEPAMTAEQEFLKVVAVPLTLTEKDGKLMLSGKKGNVVLEKKSPSK